MKQDGLGKELELVVGLHHSILGWPSGLVKLAGRFKRSQEPSPARKGHHHALDTPASKHASTDRTHHTQCGWLLSSVRDHETRGAQISPVGTVNERKPHGGGER